MPYFKGVSLSVGEVFEWENNDTFPTFLNDGKTILLPKCVKRQVERLPKKVLKKIDSKREVAIEKCLLLVSNISFTVFSEGDESWKSLSAELLQEQLKKGKDNTFIYKHVINALKYTTNATSPIIESKKNSYGFDTYQEGVVSKQYRLGKDFQNYKLISYELKTTECIERRIKHYYTKLSLALKNPIARNLLTLYSNISLPSDKEVDIVSKKLVKNCYRSKKGKQLTFLNNKAKSFYSSHSKRSFVEENVFKYKCLTSKGFLIPSIGDYKSGGRVVDSFNLMPSWIRSLVKIDNENIAELDFKALHPNIALSIYRGKKKYLFHEDLAKEMNIELAEVKSQHLSFFNKRISDMKRSVLYHYYLIHENEMLNNIIKDKEQNGYKITSRRLFKMEVDIMEECIKRLNKLDIYVLYVYDALYCKKNEVDLVKEVMNKTIEKFQVYTKVK